MNNDMINYRQKIRKLMYAEENPRADLHRLNRYRAMDRNGNLYKVVSARQSEAVKRALNRKKDRRHFSFANMRNIREVIAKLSTTDCGRLLVLIGHIDFKSGILVNERGNAMTKKQIQKTVGLGERAFRDFFRKMTEMDVIQETADGKYRINPDYHFVGSTDSVEVVKAFSSAVRKLANRLRPSELGFVYKLLPHVHFATNMICADPFEPDPTKIRFLNVRGIAELTGMNDKRTSTMLTKLRKAGVLAETKLKDDKRDVFFTVNPYVFYRKKGRPDDTLKSMFASSRF